MEVKAFDWEEPLLALACSAATTDRLPGIALPLDSPEHQAAYAHCTSITATHSRSFYYASALLPRRHRPAIRALYALCRTSDDLVDEGDSSETQLAQWTQQVLTERPEPANPLLAAWLDTCHRYTIPRGYLEHLMIGVGLDHQKTRYHTFPELARYCYGVASTVGLISMHIVGYTGREAIPYAVRLGVALQLTNILRDVAEDWQNGRLYLPLDELAAFQLSLADVERGVVTEAWRSFMAWQIERTRMLYAAAQPGIRLLERSSRLSIAAAAAFYAAILDDIEAHDYNVFSRRAHVTGWGKFSKIPGIWWRLRKSKIAAQKRLEPDPALH